MKKKDLAILPKAFAEKRAPDYTVLTILSWSIGIWKFSASDLGYIKKGTFEKIFELAKEAERVLKASGGRHIRDFRPGAESLHSHFTTNADVTCMRDF